jgi:hypothetical protein
MKSLRLACALTLSVAAIAIAFAETSNLSIEDFLVTLTARPHAALGMSPGELTATLGEPSARLAPNVWVYWDFKPVNVPDRVKYDALVVVLSNDRVSRLRLCPSAPVRAFIAQQEKTKPSTQIFAAK